MSYLSTLKYHMRVMCDLLLNVTRCVFAVVQGGHIHIVMERHRSSRLYRSTVHSLPSYKVHLGSLIALTLAVHWVTVQLSLLIHM